MEKTWCREAAPVGCVPGSACPRVGNRVDEDRAADAARRRKGIEPVEPRVLSAERRAPLQLDEQVDADGVDARGRRVERRGEGPRLPAYPVVLRLAGAPVGQVDLGDSVVALPARQPD